MEVYTVKEIKEILKMNENTINTHLYMARQKLESTIINQETTNIKKGNNSYEKF